MSPPPPRTRRVAGGAAAQNVVIGPMLAAPEFLATQHLHVRVTSHSGSRQNAVGQAVFSLADAAAGGSAEFDVVVEHLGVPAGFNLRGCVSIVYTKSLQVK